MCLVKPHYGLFVLWGALRREWRFTVACIGTALAGLAASIAIYGWADNIDYMPVFWFLSQHGESYYPNQSFNGLFSRYMEFFDPRFDSLWFDEFNYSPFNLWIYAGTMITSATILIAAFVRRGAENDDGRLFDFCT